eukprot:4342515-Alexandrium_andersonii.AAC.1
MPGQSLNPPHLDACGPEVLRSASLERMPSPEWLPEAALQGQAQLESSMANGLNHRSLGRGGAAAVREERDCCRVLLGASAPDPVDPFLLPEDCAGATETRREVLGCFWQRPARAPVRPPRAIRCWVSLGCGKARAHGDALDANIAQRATNTRPRGPWVLLGRPGPTARSRLGVRARGRGGRLRSAWPARTLSARLWTPRAALLRGRRPTGVRSRCGDGLEDEIRDEVEGVRTQGGGIGDVHPGPEPFPPGRCGVAGVDGIPKRLHGGAEARRVAGNAESSAAYLEIPLVDPSPEERSVVSAGRIRSFGEREAPGARAPRQIACGARRRRGSCGSWSAGRGALEAPEVAMLRRSSRGRRRRRVAVPRAGALPLGLAAGGKPHRRTVPASCA